MEAYQIDADNPAQYLPILQQLFREHPFIATSAWKKVVLCFENQQYTLVPSALFQEKDSADYLKLAVDIADQTVKYCIHTELGLAVVFAVDESIVNWLQKGYTTEHCCIIHQANSVIAGTAAYIQAKKLYTEAKVFVLAEAGHIHITVVEKSQLLYYNRFAYNSSDEFLQYILIVMYTLALNPGVHEVIVAGNIVKNSVVYKKMRNYIRYVSFSEKPPYLKFGWSFKKDLIINYFDVINFYPATNYLTNLKFS
jgi:hypothetical protein